MAKPNRDLDLDASGSVHEIPEFLCGCGIPARVEKSGTDRNPDRPFIHCGHRPKRCFTWLWEDQLRQYGTDLVLYCRSSTIDCLKEELDICRSQLDAVQRQNEHLNNQIGAVSDAIPADEYLAQNTVSIPELMLQI